MKKNHTSQLAILSLLALLFPLSVAAQERGALPPFETFGEAASRSDSEALDALLNDYRDAWGRQDAAALAALHAEDVEWTNAFVRIIRGREGLESFLGGRMFPGFPAEVSAAEAASLRPVSLRYLGDDAAVWHIFAESRRNGGRDDPDAARRVHFHLVLEKADDGVWRIAHTAIFDARS
ncbi:MAG: SgcJ/EcaC family oxidoreductase [Pseudomonadota bacterium]